VTLEENRKLVGRTVEVMVEGASKLVSKQAAYPASKVELGWEKRASQRHGQLADHVGARTQLVGRTRGDQVVCFDGDLALKGEILDVEITDSRGMTLFARLAAATAAPVGTT
jgi:tRNA A37 methylthiotransferase MiaB